MPVTSTHHLPAAIDRFQASTLLGVSTRTIDRYVKSGRLLAETSEGRVWLSRDQVDAMRQRRQNPPVPQFFEENRPSSSKISLARPHRSPNAYEEHVEHVPVRHVDAERAALETMQQKLKIAESRIEQLQTHITANQKNGAPNNILEKTPLFDAETILAQREIRDLKTALSKEQWNRRVITLLLYGLLIAQPIFWYVITR